MRSYLLILAFATPTLLFSQSPFEGRWTDGDLSYSTEVINDQQIQFWGGSLHEGGYGFYGELMSESNLKILGIAPEYDREPSFGAANDVINYLRLDNFELMILQNSTGEATSVLRRLNKDESLKDIAFTNIINHQLAGKYQDVGTGKIMTFYPNKFEVDGLYGNGVYKIETDYDYPTDIITINDKSFFFETSITGLKLYEAKMSQQNDLQKTETLLFELELVEKIPIVNSGLAGDYTFASLIPLIGDILIKYDVNELRIMRNEIFARYGHQFKSQDLKSRFESKPWYNSTSEDVSNKLTELERLNVQLIKQMESRKIMSNK